MELNIPEVVAEVTEAFQRYENGIMNNRPEVLIEAFWNSPLTIRYGVAENLHGFDAIAGYRQTRAAAGGPNPRRLVRTVITTYGRDFATANAEYLREGTGKLGRQSQTWMRTPDGWRVVSAHVSLLQDSD